MNIDVRKQEILNDLYTLENETEIRFVKGRLKFGDSKNSAPFPSMIVIFRGAKV